MPNLTDAQKTTLNTNINANTATAPGTSGQISQLAHMAENAFAVAVWYNLEAAGPWTVWRDLPMDKVLSIITFASMTPVDPVPTTPALAVQVWQARNDLCQTKQMSLQNLIISRTTAPMKQTSYRAGLQDCLTGIPAGASGVLIAANWTSVRDAAKFNATNAEKLFSTGVGSLASPADLGYEGQISSDDVRAVWGI